MTTMEKIIKTITSANEDVDMHTPFTHCWWDGKMTQSLGKVCFLLKRLNTVPVRPNNFIPRYLLKRHGNVFPHKNININVDSNMTDDSKKIKTTIIARCGGSCL